MLERAGNVGHGSIQRARLEVNGVLAGGDGHYDTILSEALDASAIVVVWQVGAHIDGERGFRELHNMVSSYEFCCNQLRRGVVRKGQTV